MNAKELKNKIHQYLDQVDDSFLKAIHSMLDTYVKGQKDTVIGYDVKGEPILASQAKKQYEKDIKAVEKGAFITNKDLRKVSKKWLKTTN